MTHPFSFRPRTLTIALAALAVIALVETAYIARTLWPRSTQIAIGESAAGDVAGQATPSTRAAGTSGEPAVNTRPTSPRGRVIIRSEPSGAQVTIDGRKYGVTPLTLTDVKPGEYRITLARDGSEVRQTVRVEPGAIVSVVAPLQTATASGWVALSSPIELDVFEGGALLGTTRSSRIMLPAGSHVLEVANESFGYRQQQEITIEPGKLARVPIDLPKGSLNVNAMPWADVWIDGNHVGETPIGRLSITIGTHEVVFRHPELGEKKMTAVVKAGVPARLTADLRK